MAEKFVDLMELLRGRIDPKWAKEAGFGSSFFLNMGTVYAAYPADAKGDPTLQIRSAAGPWGFNMLSMEAAIVAAKIVIGAAQTAIDDTNADNEKMLQRYLDRFKEIMPETKETEDADG